MAPNGMVSACHESSKAQAAGTGVECFDPSWASITPILLHFKLQGVVTQEIQRTVRKPLMKKQAQTDNESRSDNGGRRSGAERRSFSYTYYIPERRNGQDRRHGNDRRMSFRPKSSCQTPRPRKEGQLDQTGTPS